MASKKTPLDWWCGQPWLHATYAMGIVMLCAAVVLWPEWTAQQRVMVALCVFLPLHVFEELTWPDGFQFMMNKLVQKSDNPLAYPENRLTDMVTNFGAELLFIVMLTLTPIAGNMFVLWDLWGLLFVAFLIGFMIRLPFIISYKVKSTRFAYDSKGYFEKFEG